MSEQIEKRKYEPPQPTTGDTAHLGAQAVLSMIPAASELFQYFVNPPLEKRRQQWMAEVGEALRGLEDKKGVNLEELQSNELFVDALLHASQIAVRNSQTEKREALKNSLLNVALPNPPEDALVQMFLQWIDIFTVWHLKMLSLIDNPEKWVGENKGQVTMSELDKLHSQALQDGLIKVFNMGGFHLFIEAVYPELKAKKFLYNQIVHDLFNHGLINVDDIDSVRWQDLLAKKTTNLGKQFRSFISDSD